MGRGRKRNKGKGQQKDRVFVFLWHGVADTDVHTLYAIDIPNLSAETPIGFTTTTTITVTSTGKRTTSVVVTPEEPKRLPIDPVLRFRRDDDWPRFMTCVRLDSSLYFMGGTVGDRPAPYWTRTSTNTSTSTSTVSYPNQVWILDLSSPIPSIEASEVLRRGPPMRTGKVRPIISFVADGKIFVMSGRKLCPDTNLELNQFEIFSPATGQWSDGKSPPFTDCDCLARYVIVNRQVIVMWSKGQFTKWIHSYDLDHNTWSEFDTSGWPKVYHFSGYTFHLEGGSQYIRDTIYTTYTGTRPYVIALKKKQSHNNKREEEECLLEDNMWFDVIEYMIPYENMLATLTPAGDGRRLCYVQSANTREGCAISLTMLNLFGEGGSPERVSTAHYVIKSHFTSGLVGAYYILVQG